MDSIFGGKGQAWTTGQGPVAELFLSALSLQRRYQDMPPPHESIGVVPGVTLGIPPWPGGRPVMPILMPTAGAMEAPASGLPAKTASVTTLECALSREYPAPFPAVSLPPLLSGIYPDTATVNHLSIQGGDGLHRIVLQLHFHKAKATGLIRKPVPNHHGGHHLPKLGKNGKKALLGGAKTKVSYINSLRHTHPLPRGFLHSASFPRRLFKHSGNES